MFTHTGDPHHAQAHLTPSWFDWCGCSVARTRFLHKSTGFDAPQTWCQQLEECFFFTQNVSTWKSHWGDMSMLKTWNTERNVTTGQWRSGVCTQEKQDKPATLYNCYGALPVGMEALTDFHLDFYSTCWGLHSCHSYSCSLKLNCQYVASLRAIPPSFFKAFFKWWCHIKLFPKVNPS